MMVPGQKPHYRCHSFVCSRIHPVWNELTLKVIFCRDPTSSFALIMASILLLIQRVDRWIPGIDVEE